MYFDEHSRIALPVLMSLITLISVEKLEIYPYTIIDQPTDTIQ